MGIICDGDIEVVMVEVVLRVTVAIRSNLSISMFGGGFCCVGRGSGVNNGCGCYTITTTTTTTNNTTTTTITTSFIAIQHRPSVGETVQQSAGLETRRMTS